MSTVVKDLGAATAYGYAVEKGYTGTEAEFAELMASYATVGQTAVTAAQTATTKASEAATSATTATNKATEATTAAQTATTKAGDASQSASQASASAQTASTKASEASASATTASAKATEATTAAGTATTAKNDAVAAKTAAETAQGKAEDAQAAAEDAAESVSASAAQIATNTSDITALKEDLTTKANTDGYYEDLVSGGSTQLLSDMVKTDTTPYNYRTAGGALEIGDRMRVKEIVGGSLAVNQLVENGDFSALDGWGESHVDFRKIVLENGRAKIAPTSDKDYIQFVTNTWMYNKASIISGHKYLALVELESSVVITRVNYSVNANWTDIGHASMSTNNVKASFGAIINAIGNTASNFRVTITVSGAYTGGSSYCYVDNVQLFDLTAMFGTTIADYVYSLESGTAGAGVAWLKSHFPKIFDSGYIPYNAGTLEHVSGLSAHKMVGFNQWDEEWEAGTIGGLAVETTIHSKNFCGVLPNTTYYATCGKTDGENQNRYYLRIMFYDASKNFISSGYYNNLTFTTPENAAYFKIETNTSTVVYGNVYNHDICINLHWDGERDGEYEPYEEHSYPLDSDVTLRGIPKLDANNSLYTDGDEYASDGTVTRNFANKVFVGAAIGEYWTLQSINEHDIANFGIDLRPDKYITGVSPENIIRSNWYGDKVQTTLIANVSEEGILFASGDTFYVRISKSKASTVDEFKAYLAEHPLEIVYKLATPTTESADPYTEIQNVSNWGTEEFVTTSLVPVGHVTEYQPDLRAKIEVAPESPDTDGLYLMKRENGQNSYVAYLGELPSDPTTDGTYTLKCTVASGVATKTWEADE